ncbi:restriction endonuclease [Streptosporangium sp. NPDC020145]|uniref:nSTAND3 domain-containing NTPase n=1 Tax=Streptosporangium sp. NPDC020145 TaxID=3154694 RepID=UPI003412DBD1
MDSFDIGRLTDFDFEEICKDLFEGHLKRRLEIFSAGRDRGIDLRHLATDTGALVVVQCKHWARSKRSTLIKHIEKIELPKVKKLNPSRYILATSTELTVEAKDELATILSPYSAPEDIFGLNELAALIRNNPRIVERHLRLWLSSTAVLQSLLNKEILTRSAWLREQIDESIKTYVPGEAYSQAEDLLNRHHVCIVSGIPGIGKTTLAQVLAAVHTSEGYEVYDVSEDIKEVNSLWDEKSQQFFYYDDFLGQSTLDDKLRKNEDSRLISALERIRKSSNKRIVLTTREYILRQAKQRYERLSRYEMSPWTYVLDLGKANPLVRAKMLYNHTYFSGLHRDRVAEISAPDVFDAIISHPNFNPRIISFILAKLAATTDSTQSLASTIITHLDHPTSLWEHIVENQLDELSVQLLTVLRTFAPGGAQIDEFRKAVAAYRTSVGLTLDTSQFRRSLNILEETMIQVNSVFDQTLIRFHNPSIRDYLGTYIGNSPEIVSTLLVSATFFEQVPNIWSLSGKRMGTSQPSRLFFHSAELSAAIIRTFKSTLPFDPSYTIGRERIVDWFRRIAEAMQISNALDLRDVAVFVKEFLVQKYIVEMVPHTDWMSTMIQAIWASQSPELAAIRDSILEQVIDLELADVRDWESAKSVFSVFQEYGELIPDEAIEFVQQEMLREVGECLAYVTEAGKFEELYTLEEVESMLDYARYELGFDDLRAVEQIVLNYRLEHGLGVSTPVIPGQLPLFEIDSSGESAEVIREAMAALGDQHDSALDSIEEGDESL